MPIPFLVLVGIFKITIFSGSEQIPAVRPTNFAREQGGRDFCQTIHGNFFHVFLKKQRNFVWWSKKIVTFALRKRT